MRLQVLITLFLTTLWMTGWGQINSIGIIGSATPGGWDAETPMIQDDTNPNVWLLEIELQDGEAKFRANDSWDLNWGATTFPVGEGTQNGPNIPVTSGTYRIVFNSESGEYFFDLQGSDLGIIGSATPFGWDREIFMFPDADQDGLYTLTLDLKIGQAKFRADGSWDTNWGGNDFPSGEAVPGGADINIPFEGTYVITFNREALTYNFEFQGEADFIGIIGDATPGGWDDDTPLSKDPNNPDVWTGRFDLTIGELKFRANGSWDENWGGETFPSGDAVPDGPNINIPVAGNYKVTFNREELTYSFEEVVGYESIGIIGTATPGGWDAETPMTQDDNDPDLWRIQIELQSGEAKFRADNAWTVNWGNSTFPFGTGLQDGPNIPVIAGEYLITLNTVTGEYFFDLLNSDIGIIGSATPFGWDREVFMFPDPDQDSLYSITLELVLGAAKFRADGTWDLNWGGNDFPEGEAIVNGPDINIPNAGTYRITFDRAALLYTFEELVDFESIGIIGSATPGGWDEETPLNRDPNTPGLWTVTLDLVDGEAKFRANNDWAVNWGGNSFPEGEAIINGDNIQIPAGRYIITFNTNDPSYQFLEIIEYDVIGIIGSSSPGGFEELVPMERDPNDISRWSLRAQLSGGDLFFAVDNTFANEVWGGAEFPNGTAVLDASIAIPTLPGDYIINFNSTTLEYSFREVVEYNAISLVGESGPFGGWPEENDMGARDLFLNKDPEDFNIWTYPEVALTTWNATGDGGIKFRLDTAWTTNWELLIFQWV
jgi:starch-binding outer membrane protein SusE/F